MILNAFTFYVPDIHGTLDCCSDATGSHRVRCGGRTRVLYHHWSSDPGCCHPCCSFCSWTCHRRKLIIRCLGCWFHDAEKIRSAWARSAFSRDFSSNKFWGVDDLNLVKFSKHDLLLWLHEKAKMRENPENRFFSSLRYIPYILCSGAARR